MFKPYYIAAFLFPPKDYITTNEYVINGPFGAASFHWTGLGYAALKTERERKREAVRRRDTGEPEPLQS